MVSASRHEIESHSDNVAGSTLYVRHCALLCDPRRTIRSEAPGGPLFVTDR